MLKATFCIASALILFLTPIFGQEVPRGYLLPEETLSPNERYGVLVPQAGQFPDGAKPKNQLIETKSGRLLAEIIGFTGREGVNHESVGPIRWSDDSSLLLWRVEGKWGPRALVLLKIEEGKVAWQVDVYADVVQAILARTKKAKPAEYAKVKNSGGYGSAYPDGFTIEISAEEKEGDPLALPLKIHADLTSDPKEITNGALTSRLQGIVGQDGKFSVSDFRLGPTN